MRRALVAVAVVFLAGLLWSLRLATGESPWATDSAVLLAAWLLGVTAIAVVGMLVASSRWARRLALAIGVAELGLAVAIPADPLWVAATISAGASIVAMAGPFTGAVVRDLPPVAGPAPVVVALLLSLAATPGMVAATSFDGVGAGGWLAVVASLGGLAWYAKAAPGAVWIARVVVPVVLIAAAALDRSWPALTVLAVAGVVGVLAWKPQSLVAVQPLTARSAGRPMFAELVPEEVRDAAGIDERGRPRDRT